MLFISEICVVLTVVSCKGMGWLPLLTLPPSLPPDGWRFVVFIFLDRAEQKSSLGQILGCFCTAMADPGPT